MHLISVLLPLYDNDGRPLARDLFGDVATELTTAFGGLTAHTRAPAQGLWQMRDESSPVRDDLVIYEVIVDVVDRRWWTSYRRQLEQRFCQERVVIRSMEIELL